MSSPWKCFKIFGDDFQMVGGEFGDGGDDASLETDPEFVTSLFPELSDGEMDGSFQTLLTEIFQINLTFCVLTRSWLKFSKLPLLAKKKFNKISWLVFLPNRPDWRQPHWNYFSTTMERKCGLKTLAKFVSTGHLWSGSTAEQRKKRCRPFIWARNLKVIPAKKRKKDSTCSAIPLSSRSSMKRYRAGMKLNRGFLRLLRTFRTEARPSSSERPLQ